MRARCVLTVLIAASAAIFAQDAATFEWRGEVWPGQNLEIRNINGGIRAEPAAGTEAEIRVRITGTHPRPETIRIHVAPDTGGVLACTIYEGISVPDYCTPEMSPSLSLSNSDIRVEYTVKVPAGVGLVAKTINGRITAQLPESPIHAETVNGRVVLSTAKDASAKLVNGSISATLDGIQGEGPLSFRTVNGSIDLELDESVRASVRASTVFGAITTDFPIRVRKRFVGSSADGDLNGGGPALALATVNGSIHLRKQ